MSFHVILRDSPYTHPLANYITGFFAAWYVIWSANLLLVKSLQDLRRIQRHPYNPTIYLWQHQPISNSFNRLAWSLDLTLNFRAFGWNFKTVQVRQPPITAGDLQAGLDPTKSNLCRQENLIPGRSAFLQEQVRRLFVSGMWLVVWPVIRGNVRILIPAARFDHTLTDLLSVATTLYTFIDEIHAVVSLIAVGLLSDESWRYPPLFGPLETLLSGRLQCKKYHSISDPNAKAFRDIWGKFWHNLLKEGLQATSKAIVPWRHPKALWSLTRIWTCFILTGAVHAAASYVVSREPKPSLYAGVFYCLQPVGIAIQMAIAAALRSMLPISAFRNKAETAVNYAVGLLWLRYCFPWIADDPALREAIGAIRAI
ncbi:hypothetical protein BJY04DRAFT_216162 [Aspergillus karnatakaensis]|uniref:uncharacterized protein n=1 Tax=Aspergillus karnatakaensis TaxID=1810916 RepID=UPI003CCD0966